MKTQEMTPEQTTVTKPTKNKAKGPNKKPIFDPNSLNPYNLNFLNIWIKFPKKMVMIFISAILYNIGISTFLAKAATVATGFSALVQSLTYTVTATAPYFAYIYLAVNLPIIIIFWRKNSRLFTLLTVYWLIWQVAFQSFLLIPVIHNFFDKISIYYVNWYSPKSENSVNSFRALIPWNVYGNYFMKLKDFDAIGIEKLNSINVGQTMNINGIIYSYNDIQNIKQFLETIKTGYANPTWPIIIYTVIGGICAGSAGGIAWKNSASTAGSDFIIYYISRKKKKSVGHVSVIVSLCFASFSILLISILELTGAISANNSKPTNHAAILLRAICTVGYVFLYNFFIELIYPKYKKVKIEIYTKKPDAIIAHFKAINYWHGYNIARMVSGYTNTETVKVETFALYLEQNIIRQEILKADADAWITITKIHNIFGKLNTSKIE
ncbi:YitT family protein [Mycoplasma phocoeninasale]|uniref:YitT family protein n=1 Tax=Mycoplasma phocoeninasale TaxID=2726117 RepID=A0A858U5E7_9MOLU|nr:YitT family protein [Mycoplasma phocoeninasale]QJG66485.1 YitT family protein [Mycoplasma phocoeninasale]